MENLAGKYRPRKLEDVVEQSVVVDIVKNICNSKEITNRNFLFIGPAGCGKALAHGEPVLTVDGFRNIEDIKVGDEVITHTGAVAPVSGVFPQGKRSIYEIELADGAKIHVSDHHLNVVSHRAEGGVIEEVVTTDYLLAQDYTRFSIPIADIKEHIERLGLTDPRRLSVHRNIICIRGLGMQECTCIYVDHPDHTFITRDFVPTHNTTTARIIANQLNGTTNSDSIIEVDAASHNGVDSVREIVNQMRSYPVGSKYKIFILDECFPGDTLIHTKRGLIPICNINSGDRIYNLTGEAAVSRVIENNVKSCNLVSLRLGDKQIITTLNHLFFTDEGWVECSQLKEGDILYDYKTVQDMRKRFSSYVSKRHENMLQQNMQESIVFNEDDRASSFKLAEELSNMWRTFLDTQISKCHNVWKRLRGKVEAATSGLSTISRKSCEALAYIYVSGMRETNGDPEQRSTEGLFNSVFTEASFSGSAAEEEYICHKAMRELWEYISSNLCGQRTEDLQQRMQVCFDSSKELRHAVSKEASFVGKDENEQSFYKSSSSAENVGHQIEKWDVDSEACYAMWERTLFSSSDSLEARARTGMGIRISCSDKSESKTQSESLSYELQTRPSLTKTDVGSRGGWDRPQYEISTTFRRKENNMFRGVRVDSITRYQPGRNDELFQSHFPDTELCNAEYVVMYDLEIDGHPSFFANDVLVHNCHSFSPQSWQILLKVLEEQPARSITCCCTTNPEKIPATILSRVQTFQLSKISLNGIYNRLKYIIEQENKEGRNITYDEDALLFVAKTACGGLRDAITLLDKALSFSENITIQNLEKSLGLPSYDDYFELLNAIAKKDNEKIISIINAVYNSGVNFVKWFDGFFSFVTNIVKFIYLQDINQTMIPSIYKDKISGYGTAHSALCLKLSNKLVKMNQELRTTQYLQELAISYLCSIPAPKK